MERVTNIKKQGVGKDTYKL